MKLGILGCGTIVATYLQALEQPDMPFQITALYDIHPHNAQKYAAGEKLVCQTMEQLLSTDVQCVAISTPLDSHTKLAEQCLRAGKHVLMEKPATLSVEELAALYELADEMGVHFYVAFHSAFGPDIQWYLENEASLKPELQKENICQVACGFFDPYMQEGVFLEDRKPLGGSCVDSGVNILSVCSRLLSLEQISLSSHTQKVLDGVVYASESVYEGNGKRLIMTTGWDRNLNHKSTYLSFAGTKDRVLLEHSDQAVWLLCSDGTKKLMFRQITGLRMVNQYVLVFRHFYGILTGSDARAARHRTMQIHTQLIQAVTR